MYNGKLNQNHFSAKVCLYENYKPMYKPSRLTCHRTKTCSFTVLRLAKCSEGNLTLVER